jgi:hypothetical protein
VPIPFSDGDAYETLGSAAYLKLEPSPDNACCLGGLLVITARGEPLEFGYNRVRVPQPFLWRAVDLRRHVQRRLVASLLSVCSQQPRLLLCLQGEIGHALFGEDIKLELPVARIAVPESTARRVDTETGEVFADDTQPTQIAWQPAPPADGSPERALFEHLAAKGLLVEPFERTIAGLHEAFGPLACRSQR